MVLGEDKKRDRLRAERGNKAFMAETSARPTQLAAFHVNPPPMKQPEDVVLANKL